MKYEDDFKQFELELSYMKRFTKIEIEIYRLKLITNIIAISVILTGLAIIIHIIK